MWRSVPGAYWPIAGHQSRVHFSCLEGHSGQAITHVSATPCQVNNGPRLSAAHVVSSFPGMTEWWSGASNGQGVVKATGRPSVIHPSHPTQINTGYKHLTVRTGIYPITLARQTPLGSVRLQTSRSSSVISLWKTPLVVSYVKEGKWDVFIVWGPAQGICLARGDPPATVKIYWSAYLSHQCKILMRHRGRGEGEREGEDEKNY